MKTKAKKRKKKILTTEISGLYYVYLHVDPITYETLYVGMGKGTRAYATKTTAAGKNEYGHRSPEHSDYLDTLMEQGYLPHEWVKFIDRSLDKETARLLEKECIEKYKPTYNRKFGRKLCHLSREQVEYVLTQKSEGRMQKHIAEELGVSQMVVSRVCTGSSKNYKEMLIDG